MSKTLIRLGDGDLAEYSDAELLKDIWQGIEDIAESQGIEPLSEDEIAVADLSNEVLMREVREEFELGTIQSLAGFPKGIEAKHNIADLLDITINSVERFKSRSRKYRA